MYSYLHKIFILAKSGCYSESPCGHLVLHHGAFFQLVPNGVYMVRSGCFEKLLKVIGRLSHLVLDVMLGGGNKFLVKIVSLLVIVTHVAVGSDYDMLGSPLCPLSLPLVVLFAPLPVTLSGAP
jgi:hypothetical protein